ncbi:hypothetical protein BDR26DRAFT_616907 [Obelidium mucronatum]|nr:hypothetical protein BDR26DRAFT_616907 [Obelidium mucronatum]
MLQFNSLREECAIIGNGIQRSQEQVLKKKEEAFMLGRNETEITQLKSHQNKEIMQKKAAFEEFISSKMGSKRYKALNRSFFAESKLRDLKISQQVSNSTLASHMQEVMQENRDEFEETLAHMEELQAKECKSLVDNQEARSKTEQAIYDLEISPFTDEMRAVLLKRYLVKGNHQHVIDKKLLDQLREIQARKVRNIKELFDFKLVCTNEMFHLKTRQQDSLHELDIKTYRERKNEKESLIAMKEAYRFKKFEEAHQTDLRKLLDRHRIQIYNLIGQHAARVTDAQTSGGWQVNLSLNSWSEAFASDNGMSMYGSDGSLFSSTSRVASISSVDIRTSTISGDGLNGTASCESASGLSYNSSSNEKRSITEPLKLAEEKIKSLKARHKELRARMLVEQADEMTNLQEYQRQKLGEMKQMHEFDMAQLLRQHEHEVLELRAIHDREIAMEQSIHDAEGEILTERRILSSVLDSVIDGIIIIDTSAIIKRVNSACETIFEYKAEEIVGKNVNILMPQHIAVRHNEIIANYLRTGVKNVIGTGRRLMGRKKSGEMFNIHLSVTEVKQEGVHLFTGVIRDITNESMQEEMNREQQKKAEDIRSMTLHNEKKRADEAEQSKKQQERYIDMICHEIRNPLNGIQNNNELLMDLLQDLSQKLNESKNFDSKMKEFVEAGNNAVASIKLCAKHQKTIADDVLNMSKLSMSLIRVSTTTPFDPINLIKTIFDTFSVEAKKKDIELTMNIKSGLQNVALKQSQSLAGDPARLSQVMINLISNSIKFTENRSVRKITIEIDAVEPTEEEEDKGIVILQYSVIDTGIGMSDSEQAMLFQQFNQASYKTYGDGGSGLGLYISKELIALMGGTIKVRSKQGKGTSMTVTVKTTKLEATCDENYSVSVPEVAPSPRIESHEKKSLSKSQKRPVLIVDDNKINRKVLRAHLERSEYVCEEACDGSEAVEAYKQNPEKYCLILMDLEMPIMDGLTATKTIRDFPQQPSTPLPIIAVTGNARSDPEHSPAKFGMSGVLLKPFTRQELLDILAIHLKA